MSRRFELRTRDRAAQRHARRLRVARHCTLAVLALLGASSLAAAQLRHRRNAVAYTQTSLTALLPEPAPPPRSQRPPLPVPRPAPPPEADIRLSATPLPDLATAELPPAPELPALPELPPEAEWDAPPEVVPPVARARTLVQRTPPPTETAPPLRPPRYRHAPAPPTPEPARATQLRVRIAVSAQGEPTDVEILESSGQSELDRRTRAWILARWSFYPARRADDSPAPSAVITRIIFEDAG
ncbi:MAG: energy transducer TonB [Akkermansia sp.]